MKHKYLLIKQDDGSLTIKEHADLDKEIFSLLCEETFAADKIQSGLKDGDEALLKILRTQNLYPPMYYAVQIVSAVKTLFESDSEPELELTFDDMESLAREDGTKDENGDDMDNDGVEIDELLEDDSDDDDFVGKDDLKIITSSLKVADDELMDIDEEEK